MNDDDRWAEKWDSVERPATLAPISAPALRADLLRWWDRTRRDLPWRARPGEAADPYRVWVSEIMLQQTRVSAAIPFYEAFIARWPTVAALAAADLDDVLRAWAGLGYYARARNLHACARRVAAMGGVFPDDEAVLRALPGVGAYTAAAVAAIAFDRPAVPVDGNVVRVASRLFGIDAPQPAGRGAIEAAVEQFRSAERPGCFAQALMDLGATLCAPRAPACGRCPWRSSCAAFAAGRPERYPVRAAKPERPLRYGVAFWIERADGAALLRRRPERGLLGGMMEPPTTALRADLWTLDEARNAARVADAPWRLLEQVVRHVFTHFELRLSVAVAPRFARDAPAGDGGEWWGPEALAGAALPTVMRKVVAAARTRPLL